MHILSTSREETPERAAHVFAVSFALIPALIEPEAQASAFLRSRTTLQQFIHLNGTKRQFLDALTRFCLAYGETDAEKISNFDLFGVEIRTIGYALYCEAHNDSAYQACMDIFEIIHARIWTQTAAPHDKKSPV